MNDGSENKETKSTWAASRTPASYCASTGGNSPPNTTGVGETSDMDMRFNVFVEAVRGLLIGKATQKGYLRPGETRNTLNDFMQANFPSHSAGEIVYKAVRYEKKRDIEDLFKIAAWAFLLYDRQLSNGEELNPGQALQPGTSQSANLRPPPSGEDAYKKKLSDII